jgi:hypothetical protein
MLIVASVITCPQRWNHYQRLLRNFAALNFPFPLRTFQTSECQGNAYANNNLNARAALAYADKHLPAHGWLLYLEDDVVLSPNLPTLLPLLIELGKSQNVDCWYLCNRKNAVERQCRMRGLVVNELAYPALGAHGLLLPKRHLAPMLAAHWADISDLAMFAAMKGTPHPACGHPLLIGCGEGQALRFWQVVKPVLVEHIGVVSTYAPDLIKTLEVNHAA